MSLSDLPKLWTEPTKNGHIYGKQSTLKNQSFGSFLMPENDLESTNFANFEEVVHNFGGSDMI